MRGARWLIYASIIMIGANGKVHGDQTGNIESGNIESGNISALISQLDSDRFEARAEAVAALAKLGEQAIPPLLEAVGTNSTLELQIRGLEVLKSLAMSDDVDKQRAGHSALEQLAGRKDQPAGQLAILIISDISKQLYQRAVEKLTALGASFDAVPDAIERMQALNGFAPERESPTLDQITFGEEWHGTVADLRWLEDLPDIVDVIFVGDDFGDDYVAQLRPLKHLRRLICYQSPITHKGLATLSDMKELALVAIGYTPVGTLEVEQLCKLQSLKQASLFGTGLEDTLIEVLRKSSHFLVVDVRSGAFMGITPGVQPNDAATPGVLIQDLAAGSPGELAGMIDGDLILSIDGENINDFEQLRQNIGRHKPGKKVKIKGLRDTTPFEREVELAAWTIQDWKMRLPFDEGEIARSMGAIAPPAPNVPLPVPAGPDEETPGSTPEVPSPAEEGESEP